MTDPERRLPAMYIRNPERAWRVGRALPEEAAVAVEILREASRWVASISRPLWHADSFVVGDFERAAAMQELVLGYEPDPVACMLLQKRDEVYWPDDADGEALYLHKIAVRRAAAGQGWLGRLIGWAASEARSAGARFLRLDTADREKLVSLYQSHGFRAVDPHPRRYGALLIVRLELPL